jgi:hypothetical protein
MNEADLLVTWDVLKTFQFKPDDGVVSDVMPGLSYDFGASKLSASHVLGRYFEEVVYFTGWIMTNRTMGEINFEMPLRIASLELCAAWIVWHLDKKAKIPSNMAPWLDLGRQNLHLLPWEMERTRRLKSCENRLHCSIQRDWLKLALRSLAAILAECPDYEMVDLSFDGRVMTLACAGKNVIVGAEGSAWTNVFTIPVSSFRRLPKRLMNACVEVCIMDGNLSIDRYRYTGITFAREAEGKIDNSEHPLNQAAKERLRKEGLDLGQVPIISLAQAGLEEMIGHEPQGDEDQALLLANYNHTETQGKILRLLEQADISADDVEKLPLGELAEVITSALKG